MIKYIKGLIKRLTTPSKDKNYKSNDNDYGKYEWKYVSSFQIDIYTNIILELNIPEQQQSSMEYDINVLIDQCNMCGIRHTEFIVGKDKFIYFAGSVYNYISLLSFPKDPFPGMKQCSRLFRSLVSILEEIDIMHPMIDNVFPEKAKPIETIYLPYITNNKRVTCNDPVSIQTLDTKNINPDVLSMKYMDQFIYLLLMIVYDEDQFYQYYISDFISVNNFDECNYLIKELDQSFHSNFDISGFKNIFDINLKVTDDDESAYDNIDEVID